MKMLDYEMTRADFIKQIESFKNHPDLTKNTKVELTLQELEVFMKSCRGICALEYINKKVDAA